MSHVPEGYEIAMKLMCMDRDSILEMFSHLPQNELRNLSTLILSTIDEPPSLLTLNDDCLLEMFEHLTDDELAALSRTNTRLESLVIGYVIRRPITIIDNDYAALDRKRQIFSCISDCAHLKFIQTIASGEHAMNFHNFIAQNNRQYPYIFKLTIKSQLMDPQHLYHIVRAAFHSFPLLEKIKLNLVFDRKDYQKLKELWTDFVNHIKYVNERGSSQRMLTVFYRRQSDLRYHDLFHALSYSDYVKFLET